MLTLPWAPTAPCAYLCLPHLMDGIMVFVYLPAALSCHSWVAWSCMVSFLVFFSTWMSVQSYGLHKQSWLEGVSVLCALSCLPLCTTGRETHTFSPCLVITSLLSAFFLVFYVVSEVQCHNLAEATTGRSTFMLDSVVLAIRVIKCEWNCTFPSGFSRWLCVSFMRTLSC